MSEIQVPSHTGQSGLVLIIVPCHVKETKTLLLFSRQQKGLGAMMHQANSRLPGATGPSHKASVADHPL